MSYSKGIFWLDDCRIPHNELIKIMKPQDGGNKIYQQAGRREETTELKEQGRFTPNLLVCDNMLNDGIKPNKGHRAKSKVTGYGEFGGGKSEYHGIGEYMEVDSKSRYYDLDLWFDKMLEGL